ncbi:hypothetical protein KP509_02G115600 [Ceratopteris richardii]|uniref:Uncharacterized protein n=1 Tax=Ceratopteris richardii TaxID=49495 RepID=A0A8T2V9U9_CERRI|nr:hypothetical protein KP509_02G115600 [Ceratopteris richardii]
MKYEREEIHMAPPSSPVESHSANQSLPLNNIDHLIIFPPVMGAPPSSPASFYAALGNGSAQFSSSEANSCSLEQARKLGNQQNFYVNGMKADSYRESFILSDALVTPPLHSTLTTASPTPLSTAPFTPPPELAHLTTPSSPDVPSAHIFGPALTGLGGSLSEKIDHYNAPSFPLGYLQLTHRLYPCSPTGQLVTFNSGVSSSETTSPVPEKVPLQELSSTSTNIENQCFSTFQATSLEGLHLKRAYNAPSQKHTEFKPDDYSLKDQPQNRAIAENFEEDGRGSSRSVYGSCNNDHGQKIQDEQGCCSRCNELSAKCRDLAEALEQTRRKLSLVETKANSVDERERRLKQAQLRQESISQLSEELSWQGSALLDLQDSYLTEVGISIPLSNSKDDTSITS